MFGGCLLLFVFLSGGEAFLLRHPRRGTCLEERWPSGGVVLRVCRASSRAQQWSWKGRGLLASAVTSRCLSARRPRVTLPCREGAELEWRCDGNTLVGRATAVMLTTDRWRPTPGKRQEKGREEDLRKHISRLRRASPHDARTTAEAAEKKAIMTDEQKEYLQWFYRTEDPTVWKFVMLGLAFVCLLVGFLLLGMGAMASRRKIAKYKAAAAVAHKGTDEMWPAGNDDALACGTPSSQRTAQTQQTPCNGDTGDMKAGSIVVTWKDGNTSCLYPDNPAHAEAEVEPPLPDDKDNARVQRDDEDKEDEEDQMKDGRD
ncbi:uncharacterized protein LOC144050223 isoform X2 [Vanacampus margaritifer]